MSSNPYELTGRDVAEPPTRLLEQLSYCGPGFILSACIVGSGELIATTTLGAEAGFATLWVVLASCLVKVALQLEFGRHAIQHGETALAAINRLPGLRLGPVHWTVWLWSLLLVVKIIQLGGIIGGLGLLLHQVFPRIRLVTWCVVTAVSVAALVYSERYKLIERTSLAMTLAFTVLTLISVAALQWTEYAFTAGDLLGGLRGELPAGALLFVFAAFGLTGVGGDEIMHYTYWLLEKGYAARVGPYEPDSPAWQRRARGWMRVMTLDALVSMVSYTLVTAAFYVLGAAVLHARGEVPAGDKMVATLTGMYTESLGPWAADVFLAGAFIVLFSTAFTALAAWTRIYSDTLGQFGLIDFADPGSRGRSIKTLAIVFPVLWTWAYFALAQPVIMIMLGGLATATILLIVVLAAIDFRYRRCRAELLPSPLYDAALWLSIASIVALAGYGLWSAANKWLGAAT